MRASLAQVLSALGFDALDVGDVLQHARGGTGRALGQLVGQVGGAGPCSHSHLRTDHAGAVVVRPCRRWAGVFGNYFAGAIDKLGLRRNQRPPDGPGGGGIGFALVLKQAGGGGFKRYNVTGGHLDLFVQPILDIFLGRRFDASASGHQYGCAADHGQRGRRALAVRSQGVVRAFYAIPPAVVGSNEQTPQLLATL